MTSYGRDPCPEAKLVRDVEELQKINQSLDPLLEVFYSQSGWLRSTPFLDRPPGGILIRCGSYCISVDFRLRGLGGSYRARSQKKPSSQSCSHRYSVQNGPIERATALTRTIFVTISALVIRSHFRTTFSQLLDNFRTTS